MLLINKTLGKIQYFIRLIGIFTIFIMMLFITLNVFLRLIGSPLLGNVEIVKLMMVIIIMFGLTYCEFEKAHISVELFYEKLPSFLQKILLLFSYILGALVTISISFIFLKVGINSFNDALKQTTLLEIPLYPFEFLISLSFFVWFLQIIVNSYCTHIVRKQTSIIYKLHNLFTVK